MSHIRGTAISDGFKLITSIHAQDEASQLDQAEAMQQVLEAVHAENRKHPKCSLVPLLLAVVSVFGTLAVVWAAVAVIQWAGR